MRWARHVACQEGRRGTRISYLESQMERDQKVIWRERTEWYALALDRHQWKALVNAVVNLWFT
jgi:hypothetical protein